MNSRVALVAVATTLLLSNCSDSSKPSATEASSATSANTAPPAPDSAPDTEPSAGDQGSCHVTITGDLVDEFTAVADDSGAATFDYRPWRLAAGITPAEGVLDGHLSISCWGGTYFASIGSRATPVADEVPFPAAPGTYEIISGFCADGTCSVVEPDHLDLYGFILGDDSWTAAAVGRLDITEFDDAHIKGSFTVELATVDPSNPQALGDQRAQLTVEFQFVNPY